MKAFVIAVCIVGFTVLIIAACAICYNNVAKRLIEYSKIVTLDSGYERLNELWNKKRVFFSLFSSHKEIDKIDEQISLIGVAISHKDETELNKAKTLLVGYIEQIKKHEALTVENIL